MKSFWKNAIFAVSKKKKKMSILFQAHRKTAIFVLNLLFWLVTCFFFLRFSVLRPMCNTHIYKEFVCCLFIMTVVLVTRCLTIPKLFSCGRYGLFWLVSICLLFAATTIEVVLIKPEIQDKFFFTQGQYTYLLYLLVIVFLRDSFFFAWFLVFRLYILQKDVFRSKQRASVIEHLSVQFSLPNHTVVSVPLDIIFYIQESDHTTQVHCTDGEILTIADTLSYCKEMIPNVFWTSEGSDKMLFHQHFPKYFQTQQKPEVREIKTVILLNKRQFQIFDIISHNPGCNATFIAENLHGKITSRTIERDIAVLRNKGVVNHTGSQKGGGYEVCRPNVVQAD